MKVLFAVHDEKVSLSIVKKYQREYKEIISYKNVYYFNAILKELQRDKSYDRVIIDEDLEEFTSTSYEEKDKFVFNKLDGITDEASNSNGKDIPIILICTERRTKSEDILIKLFGIGIYNAIIGNDRSTDEVCRLINKPRSKKEAKVYYKIDAKKVDYDPEDENDVSEEEMQHILSYFKKLGKNPDKYDECFRKIASQYNNNQMKIIIAILPKNVKDVLQDVSSEYQKYVPKTDNKKTKGSRTKIQPINETEPTSEKLLKVKKESNKKQIVVPSAIDKNVIKKIAIKKPLSIKEYEDNDEDEDEDEDNNNELFDELIQKEEIEKPVIKTIKKRGRPSKKIEKIPEDNKVESEERLIENDLLFDDEPENKQNNIDDEFQTILPGFDDEAELNDKIEQDEEYNSIDEKYTPIDESLLRPEPISDDVLPGFEDVFDEDNEDEDNDDDVDDVVDNIDSDYNNNQNDNNFDKDLNNDEDDYLESYKSNIQKEDRQEEYNYSNQRIQQMQSYDQSYDDYDYSNYNNLLSSDKKVIAFVGTSKNGTSFIVNNIAKILSDNGINTAILDATQNKNSYYIYNNNDDSLRNAAANSLENLVHGIPGGMKVSKNLSVYVEVPGDNNTRLNETGPILENLVMNHSAVLIDCDFHTPINYFANAQEIFLVQSMDVLTIQPLTAFLKELKNRDALEQRKIRIIMNKAIRLRGITSKQIVGGMSRYNNPEMSMMTELFDRNSIVPIEIPFDIDAYAKYLEGLAECDVSPNKYSKDFQKILNKLSNVIYPLLPAKKSKNIESAYNQNNNMYSNGFSNNVNNTLNNMRKKY